MEPYGDNILLNTEIEHIIYQIVIFINKSVFVMWKNNNRWVEINIKVNGERSKETYHCFDLEKVLLRQWWCITVLRSNIENEAKMIFFWNTEFVVNKKVSNNTDISFQRNAFKYPDPHYQDHDYVGSNRKRVAQFVE